MKAKSQMFGNVTNASSGQHPRYQLANALLYYHHATQESNPEEVQALREKGAAIIREAIVRPEFKDFLADVDRFQRQDEFSPQLTDPVIETAPQKADSCSTENWDGSKMCLLRIAREHGDPLERAKAFRMFKEEIIQECSVFQHLDDGQIDMLMNFLDLLDPVMTLRDRLSRAWDARKQAYYAAAMAQQNVPGQEGLLPQGRSLIA